MKLLSKLLPLTVIQELASGRELIADPYDDVTIIFTDMKGFTAFSSQILPSELVNFLNTLYVVFLIFFFFYVYYLGRSLLLFLFCCV